MDGRVSHTNTSIKSGVGKLAASKSMVLVSLPLLPKCDGTEHSGTEGDQGLPLAGSPERF